MYRAFKLCLENLIHRAMALYQTLLIKCFRNHYHLEMCFRATWNIVHVTLVDNFQVSRLWEDDKMKPNMIIQTEMNPFIALACKLPKFSRYILYFAGLKTFSFISYPYPTNKKGNWCTPFFLMNNIKMNNHKIIS